MKQETTTKQPLEDSKLPLRRYFKMKDGNDIYYIGKDQKNGDNFINMRSGSEYFMPGWLYEMWEQVESNFNEITKEQALQEIPNPYSNHKPTPDSKEGLHTQGEDWNYLPHFRDDAQGHIFSNNRGKLICNVIGAASTSQKELNEYCELIVKAVNERQALLDSHRELQKSFDEAIQRLTDLYMETTDLERDKKEMERPFIIATKEFIISANKKQ